MQAPILSTTAMTSTNYPLRHNTQQPSIPTSSTLLTSPAQPFLIATVPHSFPSTPSRPPPFVMRATTTLRPSHHPSSILATLTHARLFLRPPSLHLWPHIFPPAPRPHATTMQFSSSLRHCTCDHFSPLSRPSSLPPSCSLLPHRTTSFLNTTHPPPLPCIHICRPPSLSCTRTAPPCNHLTTERLHLHATPLPPSPSRPSPHAATLHNHSHPFATMYHHACFSYSPTTMLLHHLHSSTTTS